MNSKNKIVIISFLALLICNIAFAGKEKRSSRLYTSSVNAPLSTIVVNDDKFTNAAGWNSGFYDLANTVKIEFGLDEDQHVFHSSYFYAEIVFDVRFRDATPASSSILTKTLTIDYRPGGGIYKDKSQLLWNGYYRATVRNMTITAWDSPAKTNTVTAPDDLYLDVEIATDRIYPFNLGVDAIGSSDYNNRYISSSNELEIYWDFFKGAEEYELEWQFIDDYTGTSPTSYISSSLIYDLRHDATRIITPNNYYRIPLTYEHGYVVYRIRPVGRNNLNEREDGEWTIPPFGDIFASGFGANNYYQIGTAFSNDVMNWKSTMTFAESGKQGAGVNYLDALSFNRMSIARLNSEEKSIIQSTLYDHFGKPAINLLPAPILGTDFGFYNNLNMINSSILFDKRTFDLCINNSCSGGNPTFLDSVNSTGAANYYSGSNSNKESQQAYAPSALGIPYTQIKYKKDPLGRIAEQTLPGSLHTLGSTKSITYDYTKPSQVELDRLFGSEAGKSLHYEKHFVKDPNGQLSISYIDMYGRTIGTALYGDSPSNVTQLDDYSGPINLTDEMALMNQENDHCLEVNSSFFVTYTGEQQTITYTTNIAQVIADCTTDLCLDCQYDLFISIKDECGHEVFYDDGVSMDPVEYHDSIGAPATGPYTSNCPPLIGPDGGDDTWTPAHQFVLTSISSASNIVVTFPHPGVYHVQKKLCVSDQPLDEYTKMYLNDNSCHKTLCDFIDSLTNQTSFKTCSLTCTSCSDIPNDYSTARAAMIAGDSTTARVYYPPLGTAEVSSGAEDCENFLCEQKSMCKAYKTLLMADFYPGGLYGATSNTNTTAWDHSIFNSANTVFGGYSWSNPPATIKDAYGNTASVNYLGTPTAPQSLPNYSVFINNWDDSWAEAFLPLHPDYCKMKLYCDVLEPSIKYDYEMQQIDYYDDACSSGFLYPYNPNSGSFSSYPISGSCSTSNLDPTFTTVSGTLYTMLSGGLHTAFNSSMLNYTTTPKPNIYQVASEQILGLTLPSGHTFGSDICFADMEWIKFRELYLSLKGQLYADLFTAYTTPGANGTPAPCHSLSNITNSEYLPNHISYTGYNETTMEGAFGNTVDINPTSGPADSLIGVAMLTTNCDTACHSYASLWAINIAACPSYNLNSADSTDMIRDLIEVCKRGCDPLHPWGSTDYPTGGTPTPYVIPGSSPAVTVYSFQDVLNYYFPPVGSAAFACDANSISLPSPYNTNGMGSGNNGFLSDCGCDQLLQADYDFTNSINVPAGITSARKLFNYRYGTELKDYNNLLCVCKSALATTWAPGHTWTTPELNVLLHDSVFAPPILKCNTCVNCTQIEAVITSMATDYGFTASNVNDVTTFIYNNPQVALNNFNNTFNLNNGLQDYIKLILDCRQFNNMSTQYTFSNSLNPEAAALQLYLSDLASHGLLATDHDMTFCTDEKYYMSDLYRGPIPAIGNMYYDASVSGNVLTIQIKATSTSTPPLCTIVLTLGTGTSLTWANIDYVSGIMAYAPSPSPGPVYDFKIDVTDGSVTESATGNTTCYKLSTLGSSSPYGPVLCPPDTSYMPNACQKKIMQGIILQAKTLFDQYLDSLEQAFRDNYMASCLSGLNESFTRNYDLKEYHYTLYYYDQAGNLTRTVPPNGVTPLSITSPITGPPQYPNHSSATFGVSKYYNNLYQFNSYNEPLTESTVDGGQTVYYYDLIGRIVASQNAKQSGSNAYSYTYYDTIGRIIEVGEVNNSSDSSGVLSKMMAEDLGKFVSFVTNGTRTQVIHTYYDKTPGAAAYSNAESRFSATRNYLRNRVSCVTYEETDDNITNTYDFATHYSYDEHGNVIETVQENASLDHLFDSRYKRADYEFDLISGNLKQVSYQKGHLDQFMHRYDYDPDNRLKEVFTSHDGTNWDKDAKYIYFEHGPLARIETGEKKVQSQDYFYTIHGWIKAMNSNQLAMWTDPGKDGASTTAYNSALAGLHQYVARDVASYNLNYYVQGSTKDYVPIKAHNTSSDGNPMMNNVNITGSSNFDLATDAPDLYNGNISSMVTGIVNMDPDIFYESSGLPMGIMSPFPQMAAYQYDQLHRIKQMKTFREFDAGYNEWAVPTPTNYNGSYLNQFSYDPNGNILTQYRNGASPVLKNGAALNMDDLSYTYLGYPALKTNKLICVSDNSGYTSNYPDDVDDQSASCVFGVSTWVTTNYDYDGTGNLIADSTECIKTIEWTVDRKVRKITRSEKQLMIQSKTLPDLEYLYDANRRRVCKIVKPRDLSSKTLLDQQDWHYTYYTYDASGNVIATYARTFTATGTGWTDIYDLQEYDIYGSKRLGLVQDDSPPIATRDFTAMVNHHNFVSITYDPPPSAEDLMWDSLNNYLGKKQYELTNHLGNVITVVSDRKVPAALSNTNCTAVYDMEDTIPPGTITQWLDLSVGGGSLTCTFQTGSWISGTNFPLGSNLSTSTVYQVDFDFDPGTVDAGDGLYIVMYDYCPSPWAFYMGPYVSYSLSGPAHYSFTYTPTAASPCFTTYIAFNSSSTSTHHFKIDNLTMCPVGNIPIIANYHPEVLKTSDYYPFGMEMPGRKYTAQSYRYGFNGQEHDDEVFAGANTAEYWMYDARLGRRWNIDPLRYDWQSPYTTFNSNPIFFSDPSGLEAEGNGDKGKKNNSNNIPVPSGKGGLSSNIEGTGKNTEPVKGQKKENPDGSISEWNGTDWVLTELSKGADPTQGLNLNEVEIATTKPAPLPSVSTGNNTPVEAEGGKFEGITVGGSKNGFINWLKRLDNFVDHSGDDYTKRPPVKTTFGGYQQYGDGGTRNVHMTSEYLNDYDNNPFLPGSTLGGAGGSNYNYMTGNTLGKLAQEAEQMSKMGGHMSQMSNFNDKVLNASSPESKNNNDKPILSSITSIQVETIYDTIYEMVKEKFSTSHYLRGYIMENGKIVDTAEYVPLNRMKK